MFDKAVVIAGVLGAAAATGIGGADSKPADVSCGRVAGPLAAAAVPEALPAASKDDGPWIVGGTHPDDDPGGATFHIKAVHTDQQGHTYYSVPNACVIP